MEHDFAEVPERQLEIARLLNSGGLAAMPMATLPVVALHDDIAFENYDYDILAPSARSNVTLLLQAAGWTPKRATRLERADEDFAIVFPKPSPALGSSPLDPLEVALRESGCVAFATPTQALLLLLARHAEDFGAARVAEACCLVRELPANLPKVADWCDGARAQAFRALAPTLRRLQDECIQERKERRFRSTLPR